MEKTQKAQTLMEELRTGRKKMVKQYITNKYEDMPEFLKKYHVLQCVLDTEYYFNLLSVPAQTAMTFGKLSQIFDCVLNLQQSTKKITIEAYKHAFCDLLERIEHDLTTIYDVEIFYHIIAGFLNNIAEGKIKNELLDQLKGRLSTKSETIKSPVMIQDEKDAIYSILGPMEERGIRVNFLRTNIIFPIEQKDLFLLFQSGTELTKRLISESSAEKRKQARIEVLKLPKGEYLIDLFFKFSSGVENVYFYENLEGNRIELRKALSDTACNQGASSYKEYAISNEMVRDCFLNQSSIFGTLLVELCLGEEETKQIETLLKQQILGLEKVIATTKPEFFLRYVLPFAFLVNNNGIDEQFGLKGKTILEVARTQFADDQDVMKVLNLIDNIHGRYFKGGISACSLQIESRGWEQIPSTSGTVHEIEEKNEGKNDHRKHHHHRHHHRHKKQEEPLPSKKQPQSPIIVEQQLPLSIREPELESTSEQKPVIQEKEFIIMEVIAPQSSLVLSATVVPAGTPQITPIVQTTKIVQTAAAGVISTEVAQTTPEEQAALAIVEKIGEFLGAQLVGKAKFAGELGKMIKEFSTGIGRISSSLSIKTQEALSESCKKLLDKKIPDFYFGNYIEDIKKLIEYNKQTKSR